MSRESKLTFLTIDRDTKPETRNPKLQLFKLFKQAQNTE